MIPPCMMMHMIDENKNLKPYVRYILYFIIASFVAVGLGYSFNDDGLRHLAFANSPKIMKSWGDVYPMSLFGTYDPWSFWHHFLRFIISISSFEYAHIVVNIISLFLLMILMDTILSLKLKRYKNLIVLLVPITFIMVYGRYTNLRPDLISGFFVMTLYFVNEKFKSKQISYFVIFFIALIYAPMYYLFFVYTLMFAMFFFMMSEYKKSFLMVIATIAGLLFYYFYFGQESIEIIKYVLMDSKLRNGMMVGEGQPLFSIISYIGTYAWIAVYLVLMLYLKIKHQKILQYNDLLTLILVSSLLWIGQMRYYVLFMPIFFLYAIIEIINMNVKQLEKIMQNVKYFYIAARRSFAKNNRNISFILIFSLFIGFEYAQVANSQMKKEHIQHQKNINFFKNKNFNNKRILINTLDPIGYYALYANPTIHEIPSCSIGWHSKNKPFHKLYEKLIKKEINYKDFSSLINIVKPDYVFLKLPISKKHIFTKDELLSNGFKSIKIFDKYIILSK